MASLISDFNDMILELASQIAMLCPTCIIANNMDIIRQIIIRNPKSIIDLFVLHVLKYKPQIDAGNDQFFLENTFSDETGGNNDMIAKLFEFKSLWKQLNQENRDVVKQYMQYLCQLAQTYLG